MGKLPCIRVDVCFKLKLVGRYVWLHRVEVLLVLGRMTMLLSNGASVLGHHTRLRMFMAITSVLVMADLHDSRRRADYGKHCICYPAVLFRPCRYRCVSGVRRVKFRSAVRARILWNNRKGRHSQICNRWSTLCLKKVPTFKLSVTLSNVNQFSQFLHCWKAYEICYKTVRHYPPHLRHVATLPWESKNANFLHIFSAFGKNTNKLHFFITSTFVNHPQILIFSVFKIVSFSPYWLQKNFPRYCSFTCLLLRSICGTGIPDICHSRRHRSVCQQSTWYSSAMRTRFS